MASKGSLSICSSCIKYTIDAVLCRNTCEPICFKVGVMPDSTRLYSLILVLITLMFTQGHRVAGKLELVKSSVVKLNEANQMFMMVDYVKEVIVNKSSTANMNRLSSRSSCIWAVLVCLFVC